ncbi:MAG TPA: hypothetical protein VGH70_05140 [Bradyrhizobium sp.]
MMQLWDFLARLSPLTRKSLLSELERLELCGVEVPRSADILARLRAEFGADNSDKNNTNTPPRLFFAPLNPLLSEGAPEHANSGKIARVSLDPIWEWISRDLLPTMTRDFVHQVKDLIAADKHKEARQAVTAFQTKIVKYLESTLRDADSAGHTRFKLATYTASRSAFDDLVKIMQALRARDALAKFNTALPESLAKFDDGQVHRMTALLHGFAKDNAEAVPFAIALIARRLRTPWQLIFLATKAAASRGAANVAATPFAITISMVLDRIDDNRASLRIALRNNRVVIARDLLTEIYDIEHALQLRIDQLDQSAWGARLTSLMEAIAELVEAEVSRFPDEVGHVLASRSLRRGDSLAGKLAQLAWKGRDAMTSGAAYCKKLINAA